MSEHVWLSKATRHKADTLWAAYSMAVEAGVHPTVAMTFAGYVVERSQQSSNRVRERWDKEKQRYTSHTLKWMLGVCVRTGFRFAKGVNSGNYLMAFRNHMCYFLPRFLAGTPWQLDFSDDVPWQLDVPWQVVRDWLLDHEQDGKARELEQLCEGWVQDVR